MLEFAEIRSGLSSQDSEAMEYGESLQKGERNLPDMGEGWLWRLAGRWRGGVVSFGRDSKR